MRAFAVALALAVALLAGSAARAGTIHGIGGVRLGMSKAGVGGTLEPATFHCYGRGDAYNVPRDVMLGDTRKPAYIGLCISGRVGVEVIAVTWNSIDIVPMWSSEAADWLRAAVEGLGVPMRQGSEEHSYWGRGDDGTEVHVGLIAGYAGVGMRIRTKAFVESLPPDDSGLN